MGKNRLLSLCSLLLVFTGANSRIAARAEDCLAAAKKAEQRYDIPTGLLAAIGQAESGRRDPLSGRVTPWPWTIDAGGTGLYLADSTTAAQTLTTLQGQGVRLIDVGCFQVDLTYHPHAFATLAEAFDPDANAAYAARFLSDLYHRLGSWSAAVQDYHSETPALGIPYRDRVLSLWHGTEIPEARFGMTVWTPDSAEAAVIIIGPPSAALPHVIVPAASLPRR